MNSNSILKIALISFHADPAIAIDRSEGSKDGIYVNGQSIYVGSLGLELSKLGLVVDMFTRKSLPGQSSTVHHNANLNTIRLNAGHEHFIHRDELFQYLPAFIENLINYCKDNDKEYDIVHTNYWMSGWTGLELRKKWNIKHVHTNHSLGIVKYDDNAKLPPIGKQRLSVEKQILEKANLTIATCPEEHSALKILSDNCRIKTIPCAIDVERFALLSRYEARKRLNIPERKNIVLYVGRFDPRKGIRTLIQAINILCLRGNNDLQLMIVGDYLSEDEVVKNEYAELKELICKNNMENMTSFEGAIPYHDMPRYYKAADVCVVPSHYEPFGLVAIEAMASGIPVVASDVGGLKYSVENEKTGLLFEPKKHQELANSINRVLSSPEFKSNLGSKAINRATDYFNIRVIARQLKAEYESITS